MAEPIMVGCDLHDKTMLLRIARGREPGKTMVFRNTREGRAKMTERLQAEAWQAGGAAILFAYEASGQGFGLHDELTESGVTCHVLAPTKIVRSVQQKKSKTDEKDAEQILQLLRAHVLAGNPLPAVWIPDVQTRDDRELVRTRLDVAEKVVAVKSQVQSLLKRSRLVRPDESGSGWSRGFRAWLSALTQQPTVGSGARQVLASLLRQLAWLEGEIERLDDALLRLADAPRYAPAVMELSKLTGIGVLTALVFLTEIGDLTRFKNRRQISAYLGLVPRSKESGERSDCKGHITRQGPSRVRKVLCQATWARVRHDGPAREAYQRVVLKNPKHKKIAVVASMRRLAVQLWHRGCDAQACPTSPGNGPPRACPAPAV
jgi:transposase